jgi:hypothetical protein
MNIERQLLAEMSNVYSGYFVLLTSQKRFGEAFSRLEQIRGRVETAALNTTKMRLLMRPHLKRRNSRGSI